MGLKACSSETAGFLYTLFNQAAIVFKFRAEELPPAEAQKARGIAFEFEMATGLVRFGNKPVAQVDQKIEDLKAALTAIETDPDLQMAVKEVRLRQELMLMHAKPQAKAELGTYSNGIF